MAISRNPENTLKRCECCIGMGYKGRTRRGKWRIETCRQCGGSGQVPASMRQRAHRGRK